MATRASGEIKFFQGSQKSHGVEMLINQHHSKEQLQIKRKLKVKVVKTECKAIEEEEITVRPASKPCAAALGASQTAMRGRARGSDR